MDDTSNRMGSGQVLVRVLAEPVGPAELDAALGDAAVARRVVIDARQEPKVPLGTWKALARACSAAHDAEERDPLPAPEQDLACMRDDHAALDDIRHALLAATASEPIVAVLAHADRADLASLLLLGRLPEVLPNASLIVVATCAPDALTSSTVTGSLLRALEEETRASVQDERPSGIRGLTKSSSGPSIRLAEPESPLSPRARQTLEHLLTGAADKEIAERLGLSPHTIRGYVKALLRAYRVNSRLQLIAGLRGSASSPRAL